MPQSRARRRRRHISIRLTSVVVKRLPVLGLGLSWIRLQLGVHALRRDVGCRHWYSVLVFAKRRLVCMALRAASEVPGTRRLRANTGIGIDLPARLSVGVSGALHLRGLNSRQINHLQRIASETHYRASFRQVETAGKITSTAAGLCHQTAGAAPAGRARSDRQSAAASHPGDGG